MKFRLHSTTEINTPDLIHHLIMLYPFNPRKAVDIFLQGFKGIPFEVVRDVLEGHIPYNVTDGVVIIDTKAKA